MQLHCTSREEVLEELYRHSVTPAGGRSLAVRPRSTNTPRGRSRRSITAATLTRKLSRRANLNRDDSPPEGPGGRDLDRADVVPIARPAA